MTGRSANGVPTYGAAVTLPAAVGTSSKAIRGTDGLLVVSSTTVLLDPSAAITVNDKLTLPDGTSPKILEVVTVLHQGKAYCKVVRA